MKHARFSRRSSKHSVGKTGAQSTWAPVPGPSQPVSKNDHNIELKSLAHDQPTSPHIEQHSALLALPFELRLEILHHLIGSRVIYFSENRSIRGSDSVWAHGKLETDISKLKVRWWPLEESIIAPDPMVTDVQIADTEKPSVVIPLLLSCRQIYYEAVEMLYEDSLFDFDNILTFGDLSEHSPYAIKHIRRLFVRHILPSISAYAMANPPRGLPIAIRSSEDGPVMFLYFIQQAMPQLASMELSYESDWMANSYQIEYGRRFAEWARFNDQLARYCGRPGFIQKHVVRYKRTKPSTAFGI